ncbi:hypothetical protein [Inovirus D_HF32_91]|nr:hypothetical protein [Inovirus D_HF32_91]
MFAHNEVYYCRGKDCFPAEVNKIEYAKDDQAFYIIASKNDDLQVQAIVSIDAKEFKQLAVEHLGLVENVLSKDDVLLDTTFMSAFLSVTAFYFMGKSVGMVLSFIKREALS